MKFKLLVDIRADIWAEFVVGETSGGESTAVDSMPSPAAVSGDTEIHRAHYLTQRCLSQTVTMNYQHIPCHPITAARPEDDPAQRPLCLQRAIGDGRVQLPIKWATHCIVQ